ncbi:MAG: S8 family peptidase [Bacteroidia bacterium]|nr:S8 family peptidase [Bacteroidia bacterium]
MNRIIISLMLVLFGLVSFSQTKLSPLTKTWLMEAQKLSDKSYPAEFLYKQGVDGVYYLPAMALIHDPAPTESFLKSLGVKIGTKAGSVWTLLIPANRMKDLIVSQQLAYLQLDEPMFPNLDKARKATRVDSVHQGINLPQAFTGKGVVMGVIDFGFDYNHPSFYDTSGTQYRIKKVWEVGTNGTPPSGFSYGHELSDSLLIKSQLTDNAAQTHGTGVAGIAAGSGFGGPANGKYRGMAYESDLVLVGVRRDSIGDQWLSSGFSDFIDGISYLYQYGQSVSKPTVVNISWGSQSGPHNGTSLFNQACDALTGDGKVLVMSAGNEGEERIHLSKTFSENDTVVHTFLTFTDTSYQRTWVDAWGEIGKSFCGMVTLYSQGTAQASTGWICINDSSYSFDLVSGNGFDTCKVDFLTSSMEFNNQPRLTMRIFNHSTDSVAISYKADSGTIHSWDEYYYYGYTHGFQSEFDSLGQAWAISGNTQSTVSDNGSAESVLMVGAFASKVAFSDINGNNWTYGGYAQLNRLVPFSSRGPLADGRIKPDITAPGLTLATAISSMDTAYTPTGSNSTQVVYAYNDPNTQKTYYYAEFSGTSASSPAAAGIAALLLEADPSLNPQRLKDSIQSNAIQEYFMGNLPNNNWGYGKINAYRTLKGFYPGYYAGVRTLSGTDMNLAIFPNPTSGNSFLSFESQGHNAIHLKLYDCLGILHWQREIQTEKGLNRLELPTETLSGGSYFLQLHSESGNWMMKLVKE